MHKESDPHACSYLSVLRSAQNHLARGGITYKPNLTGTELAVEQWRMVPDGSHLADTDFYARSTPGIGFTGTWRKTRSTEAPTTYRILLDSGYITIETPNGEIDVSFSTDEARTPKGAYVSSGPGFGNSYKILGPAQLLETSYRDGKVVAHSVLTLSSDGKTMTEDHTSVGQPQHFLHIVYDRN
jgi:hypothetical protein